MNVSRYTDNQHRWYAIHTYSAYEEKVAEEIKQRASNLGIENKIVDVLVPKEKQIELKNGKRRIVAKRIFQGYVLVRMQLDKEAWFTVRNTPNVTGFVGDGSNPTPIEDSEIEKILRRMEIDQPKHKINYRIGDIVRIVDGPFRDQEGSVLEIDPQKGKLKVSINAFGRETPMELDALQVSSLKKD